MALPLPVFVCARQHTLGALESALSSLTIFFFVLRHT